MARTLRIRKLFPISTNQTTGCRKFCDPSCSLNCYSFPYYYYYYTSPPPPPLFTAEDDQPHQNNHAYLYLIILASMFAALSLIAAYFVISKSYSFLFCCCHNQGDSLPLQDNDNDEYIDENQIDHPVWYIATVGLQQTIINTITICRYKKGEGLVEGTECSVCLGEFQEDETLRLLPKCNHAFHISCIDTWLTSHTNCPLCRAFIVSNNDNTEIYMPAIDQGSNNLRVNEENQSQIENPGNHENDTVLNIVSGVSENRVGMGNIEEVQDIDAEMNTKEQFRENMNTSEIDQTSDAGIDVMKKNAKSKESVSAAEADDSVNTQTGAEEKLNTASVCFSEQDIMECSSLCDARMSRSAIEKYLGMRPVSMKRSSSCGGRITYQER